MEVEVLEQEIREYFIAEVRQVEPPREWWDNIVTSLGERKHRSFWSRFIPRTRLAWALLPLVFLVIGGTVYGATLVVRELFLNYAGHIEKASVIGVPSRVDYPLQVKGNPSVAYSLPGQTVYIELTFTNTSSEPITINFFPPEININPPGIMQSVRSFAAGNTKLNLAPGEIISQTLDWDGRDNNGVHVSPGWYVVNVHTTYIHETPPKTRNQSFGDVARIYVQYPQGALEKTVTLNQSQTVSGITIILERVELTATEMKVYAFNTPPGYSLLPGQPGPVPSLWIHAEAEYSIDGGAVKQTLPSGIRFLDNGTEHIWDNLNPIPAEAKELTFRIIKLGDWDGPWEFKVPLE